MFRALDLFCGAGGVTRGLQDAGFHVTGVDLKASPRYVGDAFIHGDVFALLTPDDIRENFSFVWASPPCQFATALKTMHNARQHANLIPATRDLLEDSCLHYVIENVEGARAHLRNPIRLRGTMFGLGVQGKAQLLRERWFETSFPVGPLPEDEFDADLPVIGIYGGHYRNRSRSAGLNREAPDFTAEEGREAMGIDWMSGAELSQAIPPAYSEFIARQWLLSKQLVESV